MQFEFHEENSLEQPSFFEIRDLPQVPPRSEVPLYGAAKRATERDLLDYLSPPNEANPATLHDASLLLESPGGQRLQGLFKRPFYWPAEIRRRNILVVGQVGSGKTEELILPLAVSDIRDVRSTLLLVDFKGNLHRKLTPFMQRYRPGSRIHVLNPTNRKRTTLAWNPFAASPDSGTALADAQNFCEASRLRLNNHESDFWDGSAARWIAALMLRIRQQRGAVCPADVHEALELPRDQLLKLLREGPELPFTAAVASYLASGSHNAETVLAHAQMDYRVFADPEVAGVTSEDQMRFTSLFRRPTVLILEVSQYDVERLRGLLNLFMSQLFREAARFAAQQPDGRLPVPLNLGLDDFAAAMGRIPNIGQHLNLARSSDVRVLAAVQSMSQIDHYYGTEAGSVLGGFSTKIFKSPVDLADAEWASRQSGTMTVDAVEESQRSLDADQWEAATRSRRPASRPVLLPEEIRLAPEHHVYGRASTILLPDAPVFQAWFRPAYDTPHLAQPMAEALRKPYRRALRRKPLEWTSTLRDNTAPRQQAGLTDTRGMPAEEIRRKLDEVKQLIDYQNTTGSARKWWDAFEEENRRQRLPLVLRLAEELAQRQATVTEFFLAYIYSNTDNIQGNLFYLDYTRIRKADERKKKEQREQSSRDSRGERRAGEGPQGDGEGETDD